MKARQFLGLVGNTGRASEPHTHIEVELNASGSPLRPFPFHDTYVLSENAFHPPDPEGPWSKLNGRGLSKERVVWPGPTAPAWYPPGWGEVTHFGYPHPRIRQCSIAQHHQVIGRCGSMAMRCRERFIST